MQNNKLIPAARARLVVAGLVGLGAGLGLSAAQADDLRVVATIKPIHSLVAQVMGETGTPGLLVKGAASPHSYSLKPSDAKALNEARVVFRVSETIEPFTKKIVASLPKAVTVATLAEAPGVTLLETRTGDTFEAHAHDHDGGDDHGHDATKHEDHGHEEAAQAGDGEGDQPHGSRDGHVWLDPQNAIAMVNEIARVLKEARPDLAATFDANAAAAIQSIKAVQEEIAAAVAPLRGKPYAVFHDAYQYFERRFDLPALGSITVSPEVQPSAKRISEIRTKIRDLKAACVFAEPQFKSKLVDAVLEGTGARAGSLDPEGAMIEPGPQAYTALLRSLAANLKGCLAPQG